MTSINVKVVLDSVHHKDRLTTLEVEYHRWLHPEMMTHRQFSRSSASSRAIPVTKQLNRVKTDPALPIQYGANRSGMQSDELLSEEDAAKAEQIILKMRDACVQGVTELNELGLHKQWANRYIEPWMWHKIILSSTEWDNFLWQRLGGLPQPEMAQLASQIKDALDTSEPSFVDLDEWHTPYILEEEYDQLSLDDRIKISVARCARVSYLNVDGTRDLEKDLALYKRLATANPPHYAPGEHVATPQRWADDPISNYVGWTQWRHIGYGTDREPTIQAS